MAQKKKKPDPAKRARNSDGTYKADNKSTPNVNEAYESPKPGTKATSKPRNPAAKQREASTAKKPAAKKAPAKKPAAKKPAQKKRTYAPKVREATPVEEMLDASKPTDKAPHPGPPPTLSRYTPPVKKSLRNRIWGYFFGE